MPTALITWDLLPAFSGLMVDRLQQAGFEVKIRAECPKNEMETVEALKGVAGVIAGSEPYNDQVLAALPELRVISRGGVGLDTVDVDAATRRGKVVTVTGVANSEAVAEHTFALLLSLTRRVLRQATEIKNGGWSRPVGQPLRQRTLGIVGLGRIGRAVADRAAGFHLKILGCDDIMDRDAARRLKIELVDLDALLTRSDFISLHVPLTDKTRGLIDRATLARMKAGSILVNTARGGLVVENDLLVALRSGRLAAAGLDVFAEEPIPPGHPFLNLDNVLLSPHIAGGDQQSVVDMGLTAVQNIIDLYKGKWPEANVVNPSLRASWRW